MLSNFQINKTGYMKRQLKQGLTEKSNYMHALMELTNTL